MGEKIRIIAGPCQHESLEHSLEIAKECQRVCNSLGFEYIFKASFDKANRTNINGVRGLGLEQTMNDFFVLKQEGFKLLTDVHETNQVSDIARVVDVIQIPAFLCRQTDLIREVCKTDCIVNIKKGQFLAPWDVKGILSKCEGAKEVWITERGTSFGYNTLVVDFTGLQYMIDNLGKNSVVFDVTHSVQKPGGLGTSSGGNREYVPGLVRAGAALGVTNFFMEVHPNPDNAPSDGPNMLRLEDFEKVAMGINRYKYNGIVL